MRLLLSIFSFDTLEIRNKITLIIDVATVLLIIVIFDFSFRVSGLTEKFLHENPKSETGLLIYLENTITEPPELVFFGDSVSRYAILPKTLAGALGLPGPKVANLSLTSGTPYDAFKMYVRNEDRLSSANYIFYCVNEFQFNENWHEKNVTNRWRYLMDFKDLQFLTSYRGSYANIFSSLFSYLRLYRDSYIFTYYLENPRRLFDSTPNDIREDAETGFLYIRDDNNPQFPQIEDFAVKRHMEDYSFSERMLLYLEKLSDKCAQNAQSFIVIEIPKIERYRTYIRQNYREYSEIYRNTLTDFFMKNGIKFISNDDVLSEISLDDSYYVDYGHLNIAGAEKVTLFLADYLRRNLTFSAGSNSIK